MKERLVYLQYRVSLADAGTRVFDITATEAIRRMWVELRATNGATNNQGSPLAACLKRVQVIDGGQVEVSMDGYEAMAIGAYHLGKMPAGMITELPDNVQSLVFPIAFGRGPRDNEFGFDPRRYVNPQISVQWDLAAVNAVGATGFVTGSGVLTVLLELGDEMWRPSGRLLTKELYSWTTAGSGIEYVELPRDLPLRALYLRLSKSATAFYSMVNQVRLNCDQGRFVPLDMRMTDVLRMHVAQGPRFEVEQLFHRSNGDTLAMALKHEEAVSLQSFSGDNVLGYNRNGYGEGALSALAGGSAQTSDISILARVSGWLPWGVARLGFGDPDDPATWFPAPDFQNVKLELTQGSASGVGYVVTEQVQQY